MEHRLFVVGKGYAWHLSRASPLLDAQGEVVRWYGTTTDIDDQKQREENIRDLMAEVNHRSRNLLAVAQAIARCGVANATTIQEFQATIFGTVAWTGRKPGFADRSELARRAARSAGAGASGAVCGSREKRFVSEGPMVLLSPNATQTLGLALHELCDNALKHGALSNDGGPCLSRLADRRERSRAQPRDDMARTRRTSREARRRSPGSAPSCSSVSPPLVSTLHRY